jgi:iron complex transport system substrate-binding protein
VSAWRGLAGLALAGSALALALAAGCARAPAPPPERVADPRRVVALAPSLVEILYELDLGDRVVGVGDYCRYPPEAEGKPRLGGLFDPHLEEITRLEPDLAILLPSEERLRRHLEALDVEVLTVASESLDEIAEATMTVARRFSVGERGGAFVRGWREALAPRPLAGRPRVMLAVSRQRGTVADALSAGPGTFYHELLERMGAVNVFADAASLYPQVSLEEAMQRLPEAIIDLRAEQPSAESAAALRADWEPLRGVPALERECYAVIGGDWVLLPGPRVPELYRRMRAVLEECGF